jgi:hypothetical protein
VQDPTGFTFALSPDYVITAVLVDGVPTKWSRTGSLLGVSAPSLLPLDSVNKVTVSAKGTPRDMLELIPDNLKSMFRVTGHPVRTQDLIHLGPSALFYPMTTCIREDIWTSTTTLVTSGGWEGISNGKLTSSAAQDGLRTFLFEDERPDMVLEVLAGPFERAEDKGDRFTVTHYFQPGSLKDTSAPIAYARRCYDFYATTFQGDFDPDPLIVHLRDEPGISHCLSYVVIYNRQQTVLSHELAHLWWGSLVKMDPVSSSMWYEGLTEYSNTMFIGKEFEQEYSAKYLGWRLKSWRDNDFPPTPWRDVRMWSPNRGLKGYVKGVAAFRGLHTLLGEEKFIEFLRIFAKRGGTFADTPALWEDITKVDPDLDWYVRSMFYGTGFFDLAIENVAKAEDGSWVVTIRAKGQYFWRGPVTLLGESDKGTFSTSFNMEGQTSIEVELRVEGELKFVAIDPHQSVPELVVNNNLWAAPKN